MSNTEFFGNLAAICTTISFIPQVIQILKTRNTQGISLGMYSIFVFGILMWMIYGFLLNERPVIIANIVTFLLSGCILALKIKDTLKEMRLSNKKNK